MLLVTVLLVGFVWTQPESETRRTRVLLVEAVPVAIDHQYLIQCDFIGRVEATRSSILGFELGGLVSSVLVEEGEAVRAGQALAKLDTARLNARRAELVAARAEAEAALELARLDHNRVKNLVSNAAVAQQRGDDARQTLAIRSAGVNRVNAQIESVEVDIAKSTLTAPFAGRVQTRFIDEGAVVGAGAPVLRVLESHALEVRVGLAPEFSVGLEPGAVLEGRHGNHLVQLKVERLLPSRSLATGTVDAILTPLLHEALIGGSPSATPYWQEGNLVRISLERRSSETGAWLERSALTEGARGLWTCYVLQPLDPSGEDKPEPRTHVTEDGLIATHRLESRPLEILHLRGEHAFVRGPLRDGELVMRGGIQRVVPGLAVAVRQLEATRPGSKNLTERE